MKICIAGDSWACGEWNYKGNEQYINTHPGLTLYLSEQGHEVTNVGEPAISNNFSIWLLNRVLKKNSFDYIFWFKSDPFRNLRPYAWFQQPSINFQMLLDKQTELALNDYQKLNSLGVKIHCIGGCGKLDVSLMENFTNLVPYIPCLSEMIEPRYKHPIIWQSKWHDLVRRQFDLASLDKLIECKKQQDNLMSFREYFWPDGRHPNRFGYKVLHEKICTDFNL